MTAGNRLAVIVVLGTAQTLAWASSFYLPAILGDRIAEDLGISSTWFFAAFSAALVVSAIVGPRAGRTVDAIGGREVLVASNLILAVGLTILALVHSHLTLWFAWLLLGLGMGIGLYDTAFAALGGFTDWKPVRRLRASPCWPGLRARSGGRSPRGVPPNSVGGRHASHGLLHTSCWACRSIS